MTKRSIKLSTILSNALKSLMSRIRHILLSQTKNGEFISEKTFEHAIKQASKSKALRSDNIAP